MPISIAVDAHLVTLTVSSHRIVERQIQVGRTTQTRRERVEEVRRISPRYDESAVRQAVGLANQIWAQADIRFILQSIAPVTAAAPNNAEVVDDGGFIFLARQCPARRGISLLLVDRFSSRHLGGRAVEELRACILPSLGHPLAGKTLAHEFGHLLSLPDLQSGNYNLMYQALRAGDNLTAGQRNQARRSGLARRFGATTR